MPLVDPAKRLFILLDYEKHRTMTKLVKLLHLSNAPGTQSIIDILHRCETKRCNRAFCPKCGLRLRAKEVASSLNKMWARCDGHWPSRDEISWVTLRSLSTPD